MVDKDRLHTILATPDGVHADDLASLDKVIDSYPYFQAARSVRLKCLHNNSSPAYNKELQVTAAHTADRSVLFDFITSEVFLQNRISEQIKKQQDYLESIEVDLQEVKVEETSPATIAETSTIDEPIQVEQENTEPVKVETPKIKIEETDLNEDADFTIITDEDLFRKRDLSVDEPLQFENDDKHSFTEWLKLTQVKPIERSEETSTEDTKDQERTTDVSKKLRQRQMEKIDQFLADKPKIKPRKTSASDTPLQLAGDNSNQLMTETLAQVYLAQKNYGKAIKSYEILILQHPEKSGFFADRIQEIKNLQSNT